MGNRAVITTEDKKIGANIIKVLRKSSGRTPATYAFSDLLNIAEGREVF